MNEQALNGDLITDAATAPCDATVDVEAAIGQHVFQRLDPNYIACERIASWITALVISGVLTVICSVVLVANWPPNIIMIMGGGFALLLALVALAFSAHCFPKWRYQRCQYCVDERGIDSVLVACFVDDVGIG